MRAILTNAERKRRHTSKHNTASAQSVQHTRETAKILSETRADFSLTEIKDSINFSDFESHPEAAVLLHHLNSGHGKFHQLDELLELLEFNDDADIDLREELLRSLLEEIRDEQLTPDALHKLVARFLSRHGKKPLLQTHVPSDDLPGLPPSVDAHHLLCGMCGMTNVQGRFGLRSCVVPHE